MARSSSHEGEGVEQGPAELRLGSLESRGLARRIGGSTSIAFLVLALIGVVALVGGYLFGPARYWFTSDGAQRCVMAEVAVRQGRYVPRDWTLLNGDIPFLPPYAVSVLLNPIMGVSFDANAVAIFSTYLFVLACLAAFTQKAYDDLETTLVTTTIVASGVSAFTLECLIANGWSYAFPVGLSLCLLGLALERAPAAGAGRIGRATLVALVALLLTVSNPSRAILLTFGPLAISWAAIRFVYRRSETERGSSSAAFWGYAAPLGVGALGGAWLHGSVLLPSVANINSVATARIASLSKIEERLRVLPGAWLSFLQPLAAHEPGSAFEVALSLWGGLLALGLVVCVALALRVPRNGGEKAHRVAWWAASGLALPLGAIVVSGSLYQGFLEIRYALLGIVLAVPVSVWTLRRSLMAHPVAQTLATVVLTMFSVGVAGQWHSAGHNPDSRLIRYHDQQTLIKTLANHRVRVVLATYWNSYVLRIFSRGSLHGFPIAVTEGGVVRDAFLSYQGIDLDWPDGRSAIALTDTEASSAAVWEEIEGRFGPPRLKARSGPFRVWIYDTPRLHWALGAGPRIDSEVPQSRLRLDIERKRLGSGCMDPNGCTVRLRVRNGGAEIISSRGERPLRVGVHSLNRAGRVFLADVARIDFERALAPGESSEIELQLPWTRDPEVADLRVCLLQEGVAWLCNRTRPFEATLPGSQPGESPAADAP